jgi:hypothetical protein
MNMKITTISFFGKKLIEFCGDKREVSNQLTFSAREWIPILTDYIEKIKMPGSDLASINLFSPDKKNGTVLMLKNGVIEASFSVDLVYQSKDELRIRRFFENENVKPSRDYLADDGGSLHSIRILHYPIYEGEIGASNVIANLMNNAYEITSHDTLCFSIWKWPKGSCRDS